MTPREVLRRAVVIPLLLYRKVVSPLKPPACIYRPTCSSYAEQAILRHGVAAGMILAIARLFRCVGAIYEGGEDPVPAVFSFSAVVDGYRRFLRTSGRRGPDGDTKSALPRAGPDDTMGADGGAETQ